MAHTSPYLVLRLLRLDTKAGRRLDLHSFPAPTGSIPTPGCRRTLQNRVEKLLNLGLREVLSARIGELVMAELKKLDKVAYVRFASVYRSFEDIDEFKTLVDEVRR